MSNTPPDAPSPPSAPRPARPPIPRSLKLVFFIGGTFVLLTGGFGLIFGVIVPAIAAGNESMLKKQSAATLVQLADALRTYAADNAGHFPESPTSLSERLVPKYLPALPVITPGQQPITGEPAPLWHYHAPTEPNPPSTWVLLYELPGLWHRGGGNIVFADGNTQFLTGLRFDELVEKLEKQSRRIAPR